MHYPILYSLGEVRRDVSLALTSTTRRAPTLKIPAQRVTRSEISYEKSCECILYLLDCRVVVLMSQAWRKGGNPRHRTSTPDQNTKLLVTGLEIIEK